MEMNKEVQEEENICTALLTAGVVLSMACLKHFSAVSSLIEQWRAWVFIVLNVVLLAIYFTSNRPDACENQDFKILGTAKLKIRRRKRAKRVCPDFVEPDKFQEIKNCVVKENVEETKRLSVEMEDAERGCFFGKKNANDGAGDEERESVPADNKEDDDNEPSRLSNEELNERVEAFIAMFRQHLVLDARRGRDRDRGEVSRRRQAETVNSHEKGYHQYSNINFSAREVTCSV